MKYSRKRYLYATYVCLISMGSTMVIDSPGALQHSTLINFNITSYQFSLLYSVSSWASCLDLIHGYIVDRYLGLKVATFIYATVLCIGSIIYSLSAFTNMFNVMLGGRFIFGLGVNPIMLCLNGYILHWFGDGKELNTVFAIQASLFWLGSSLIYLISYKIETYAQTFVTKILAFGIAVSSTIMSSVVIMLISSLLLAFGYNRPNMKELSGSKLPKDEKTVGLIDIIRFPTTFWLLNIGSFVYFMTIFNFLIMSENFFVSKYNMTVETASSLTSLLGILVCAFSPVFGFIVDRFGRNLFIITLGVVLSVCSHCIFAFTMWNPIIPLVFLSISATLSNTLFPLFNYIVEEHQINTAYGIAQTGLNCSFAVGSLIAGYIIDEYGYATLELFYFYFLLCSAPSWILIWFFDAKSGSVLNLSAAERKEASNVRRSLKEDNL